MDGGECTQRTQREFFVLVTKGPGRRCSVEKVVLGEITGEVNFLHPSQVPMCRINKILLFFG